MPTVVTVLAVEVCRVLVIEAPSPALLFTTRRVDEAAFAGVETEEYAGMVGDIVTVVRNPWSLKEVLTSRTDDEEDARGKTEDDEID